QRGVQINFQSDIKKKIISIDEEKVERILLNLLSNALKFTPRNKQIHVKVFAKRFRKKNMVCISIRDEGIGIPKDKQASIFERFGQANSNRSRPCEGTGIGLYLVKLLVNAMDGMITLESEEETGSNFTVMLPVNKQSPESPLSNKDLESGCNDSRLINELAIQFSDIYY
ncbi:MAG TPA: ATP-binding protein, partial [Anaerovoracaceae bacterium]|nr:ATP-binding protein [Anaerovoracaceae bacterium]